MLLEARTRRELRAGAMIMLATTLMLASGTAPAEAGSAVSAGPRDGHVSVRKQKKALRHWTPERMRNARPIRMPKAPRRRPVLGSAEPSRGEPGRVEGTRPGPSGSTADLAPASEVYEYPFPYTRHALDKALERRYPYRTIGKLFGRTAAGARFVCSAASVASPGRHIIWTAGHCVSDGQGNWHRQLVFVPALRGRKRPYGRFPVKKLFAPTAWHDGGDLRHDYAAARVGKGTKGKKLRKAVGTLGFLWNQARDLHWNVFGYPAAKPFNGKRIQVCQASRATDDLTMTVPEPMGIGCDQTGGSSGGPWVYRLGRGNYIGSNSSYRYDPQPEALFGPYLTALANVVRCRAAVGRDAC